MSTSKEILSNKNLVKLTKESEQFSEFYKSFAKLWDSLFDNPDNADLYKDKMVPFVRGYKKFAKESITNNTYCSILPDMQKLYNVWKPLVNNM